MITSTPKASRDQTDLRRGFCRTYALPLYWLVFALFTTVAARDPGFVPHREHAPYPWVGLTVTCALLALETGILGWILRPRSFDRSWGRLGAALALYLGFAAVTCGPA